MEFFDKPSVRTVRRAKATKPAETVVDATAVEQEVVDRSSGAGAYTEPEAAVLIGVSQPTLRNWRVGYKTTAGVYPPRLTEGKHWYKLRQSKRAPVMFNKVWVDKIAEAKKTLKELGL